MREIVGIFFFSALDFRYYLDTNMVVTNKGEMSLVLSVRVGLVLNS